MAGRTQGQRRGNAPGTSFPADCLTFAPQCRTTSDGSCQVLPSRVWLADSTVAGDSTFIARIRIGFASNWRREPSVLKITRQDGRVEAHTLAPLETSGLFAD